jgi:hypothetical protein
LVYRFTQKIKIEPDMAHFTREVKLNENTQVNFNQSREIAYWAKKFNMSQEAFQQVFQDNNFSITKTLAACTAKA